MTFENRCNECGATLELVAQKLDSPLPACPQCGLTMERLISAPAVVWTKPMAAYGDRSKEGYKNQQQAGGHFAMEKDENGNVSRVLIDSHKAQADYCKRNNLINPNSMPSNISVSKDGRSYETTNKCEI